MEPITGWKITRAGKKANLALRVNLGYNRQFYGGA
jgi:hypothetical protein